MTHLSSDLTRAARNARWPALLVAAAVGTAALLSAAEATAQDVPAVVPVAPAPLRQLSVTVSPIHLAFPVLEITGELAIQPKLSVAAIAGYGSVKSSSALTSDYSVLELGAQVRYYLFGDFEHGLQLGAEVLYLHASTSGSSGTTTVKASGEGLAIGPFVGYKVVSSMGFTFDAQLGAQRVGIGAKASASNGQSASATDSDVQPLLNLNVGWTF